MRGPALLLSGAKSKAAVYAGGTRERILSASEELFLNRGYAGVSVRDITRAAGVNVASVNYHFGGKDGLYREFFRLRVSELCRRKIEALSVEASRPVPDPRRLIRIYVEGFFGEVFKRGGSEERFLKLVIMEMSGEGAAADVLYKEVSSPILRLMTDAVKRARPGLGGEDIALCIMSITGQMFHFVRAREMIKRIMRRGYNKAFIEDIIDHITEFSLRGLGV